MTLQRDAAREQLRIARVEVQIAQAEAHVAREEAVAARKEASTRSEEQALVMAKVEAQLLEHMNKNVVAQQALAAAEDIQRRLDQVVMDAGKGLTLVLLPE